MKRENFTLLCDIRSAYYHQILLQSFKFCRRHDRNILAYYFLHTV